MRFRMISCKNSIITCNDKISRKAIDGLQCIEEVRAIVVLGDGAFLEGHGNWDVEVLIQPTPTVHGYVLKKELRQHFPWSFM